MYTHIRWGGRRGANSAEDEGARRIAADCCFNAEIKVRNMLQALLSYASSGRRGSNPKHSSALAMHNHKSTMVVHLKEHLV